MAVSEPLYGKNPAELAALTGPDADRGVERVAVRVEIEDLTGKYALDARAANEAVVLPRTPDGFVWHHVEDALTLQLLPQDIHAAVRHTGGAAVLRGRLNL